MQKHQKRQIKSSGSLEKVGLNHAEASEKADKIVRKPGESRSKSCRSSRKGRQSQRRGVGKSA